MNKVVYHNEIFYIKRGKKQPLVQIRVVPPDQEDHLPEDIPRNQSAPDAFESILNEFRHIIQQESQKYKTQLSDSFTSHMNKPKKNTSKAREAILSLGDAWTENDATMLESIVNENRNRGEKDAEKNMKEILQQLL